MDAFWFVILCAGMGALCFVAARVAPTIFKTNKIEDLKEPVDSLANQKNKEQEPKESNAEVSKNEKSLNWDQWREKISELEKQLQKQSCVLEGWRNMYRTSEKQLQKEENKVDELELQLRDKEIKVQEEKTKVEYWKDVSHLYKENLENSQRKITELEDENRKQDKELEYWKDVSHLYKKNLENSQRRITELEQQLLDLEGEIKRLEDRNEKNKKVEYLPFKRNINVKGQLRKEIRQTDTMRSVVEVPLEEGEEGFIDPEKEVKYVRKVEIVPVPLDSEDDFIALRHKKVLQQSENIVKTSWRLIL